MRRVCVFCGSSPGRRPAYLRAAHLLAQALVRRDIGLVYGGSAVGIMGEIAAGVFHAGGEVIGVIPQMLVDRGVAFQGLRDLRVVDSLRDRKQVMGDLSDGFIALPGGLGTLDEVMEVLAMATLGTNPKPCGLVNVQGYYDGLLAFLRHTTAEGFVHPDHLAMVLADASIDALLDAMAGYHAPQVDKACWIRGLHAVSIGHAAGVDGQTHHAHS